MRNRLIVSLLVLAGAGLYLWSRADSDPVEPSAAKRETGDAPPPRTATSARRVRPTLPSIPPPPRRLRGRDDGTARDDDPGDDRPRWRRRRGRAMERFDTDGDGRLSEQERAAMREARGERRRMRMLEAFDSDGDGQLDDDEQAMLDQAREARIQDRTERMLTVGDTDSDGMLSRGELEQGPRRLQRILRNFDDIDRDGDALISGDELEQAMREQRARRERRRRGDDASEP